MHEHCVLGRFGHGRFRVRSICKSCMNVIQQSREAFGSCEPSAKILYTDNSRVDNYRTCFTTSE